MEIPCPGRDVPGLVSRCRLVATVLFSTIALSCSGFAQFTLYWGGLGASGTWNTSTENWNTHSAFIGTYQSWANFGYSAYFPVGGGTVTVAAGGVEVFNLTAPFAMNFSGGPITVWSGGVVAGAGPSLTIFGNNFSSWAGSTISFNNLRAAGSITGATINLANVTADGAISGTNLNLTGVTSTGSISATQVTLTSPASLLLGPVNVSSGFVVQSGSDHRIDGALAGTGGLTLQSGTSLLLAGSANNTYSGGTTLSSATLYLGKANALGSGAITTVAGTGSTLWNASNSSLSLGNPLTLGSNSTLQLTSPAGHLTYFGQITASSGAALRLNPGTTLQASTASGLGTLQLAGGTVFLSTLVPSFEIQLFGSVTNTIRLSNEYTVLGSTRTLGSSTLSLPDAHRLIVASLVSSASTDTLSVVGSPGATLSTLGLSSTFAGTLNLSGPSLQISDNALAAATVMGSGALSYNTATIGALTGGTFSVNGGLLRVGSGQGNFLLAALSGSSGFEKVGTNTATTTGLNLSGATTVTAGTLQMGGDNHVADATAVTVASGATFDVNGKSDTIGSIAGAGHISLGTGALTTGANNSTTTFSGVISGPGALTKTGSGTLTLTGPNTYTGATTVTGGTLQVGNGGTTGNIAGDIITHAAVIFNRSDPLLLAGAISGSGMLTKLGAGSLTLTGFATHTGGTTVSAGILQIGNGGTSGSLAGNVVNNASLVINRSDSLTYADTISGTGTVTKNGSGTLILTGANTYTGTTTINAGALLVGNGGTTGSIAGNLVSNAGLVFNRSDSPTYAGAISGSGTLTKLGAGTLTLTGPATHTGGTTISAGTLQIGNGGTAGSLAGNVTNQASLVFNRADSATHAGAIFGPGTLTKTGAGTLILTGANTYTGITTINAGALLVGNGGTTGSIAGNIINNASLVFNRVDSLTHTGAILGPGTLTKTGAGTLTLTGAATHTGGTTISAGTLQIGAGGASGSVAGDIVNNASLVFNRADSLTHAGAISGTGALGKTGGGTLTLTGAATHSGGTTVSAGTLQVGSGGLTGSLAGNVSVAGGAILQFNRSIPHTFGGTLTGVGTVMNSGLGQLTLTNSTASFNGSFVNHGSLRAGSSSTFNGLVITGTGSLDLGGFNATLTALSPTQAVMLNGGTLTLSGVTSGLTLPGLSGNGKLVWQGAGNWTLGTISGGTPDLHLNGGTLSVATQGLGSLSGTGSSGLTLVGTASFAQNSSDTFAGSIAGPGGFAKTGSGTLTLTGAATHSGATTISAGTLQIGAGGASGSIAGNITNNAALVFNRSDSAAYAGIISGSGTLTKTGAGTLTLTGANTYSGGTLLQQGTARISNTSGSVFGTGAVTLASAATLTGDGAFSGALTLGGTVSPGNSPGLLEVGATTFAPGGTYVWELNDAAGAAGAATGWDLLSITGALNVTATSANPFTIELRSLGAGDLAGAAANFDAGQNRTFLVASTTAGITGFDASAFSLDLSGFANDLLGGSWSIAPSGNNLNLVFTAAAIPEPSTYAIIFGAAALALAAWRRRGRRSALATPPRG